MKRLIPILFVLLFTGACEKKTCWECTIFTEYDYLYNSAMDSFDSETREVCDMTETEIGNYEEIMTYTREQREGIYANHYDLKSTCHCLR